MTFHHTIVSKVRRNMHIQFYKYNLTSIISSGNKKMEHPSFRATLIIYVAFNFLSSSAIMKNNKVRNFFRTVLCISILLMLSSMPKRSKLGQICQFVPHQKYKKVDIPVSPLVTTLQLTTLGSTALRSSRKKIPFERFLS